MLFLFLFFFFFLVSKHVALRPQKRGGLLGTGTGGGVGAGKTSEWLVRAIRPSKDRGGRGPPPEQLLIC